MILGILVAISIFALLGAMLTVSKATLGVGLVGLACYLGIMARLVQADIQHNLLRAELKTLAPPDREAP